MPRAARRRGRPIGKKLDGDGPDDSSGDVGLDEEAVGEWTLERVGPQLCLAVRFDELRRDAHAVGFSPDRSFDDVMGAQGVGDLANRSIGALYPRAGRARDDAESIRAQAAKLCDEL